MVLEILCLFWFLKCKYPPIKGFEFVVPNTWESGLTDQS